MSNVGVNQRLLLLEVKHYVNQLVQFSSSLWCSSYSHEEKTTAEVQLGEWLEGLWGMLLKHEATQIKGGGFQ